MNAEVVELAAASCKRWVAPNVVELNSACVSRRQTTNLRVGRSNRSGRAIKIKHLQNITV